MITILVRTLIIYFFLIVIMRTMGKRQIGELEVTDLVTTLLISEIAALPITNQDIPVLYALLPMAVLLFLEVTSSVILIRYPKWKGLVSARPTVLIRKGKPDLHALSELRMSMDELVSEVRQQGVRSLASVEYAILEKNGKLTLLTFDEPNKKKTGLMQIVYCNGEISQPGLSEIGRDEAWLCRALAEQKTTTEDIFCATANEEGELYIIYKESRS